MDGFLQAFETDAARFANAQDDLSRGLEQVGLQLPENRQGFLELMQSLDATTESGREQIAMLLELTGAADEYYSQLEQVQSERDGDRPAVQDGRGVRVPVVTSRYIRPFVTSKGTQ